MSARQSITAPTDDEAGKSGEYVVVARRYRPQTFSELLGQEHVAQALSGAINSQRVGHAYLFTGARGVGKTSAARILAKSLNCVRGPTPVPCNECDSCQGIAAGGDIDVLEIDGASNRGIDEMRELRQNVGVRPSRSRFKIYIIDEVHMLTEAAFNALLKTLEEPPEHVKFIFCTTEPEKIPVTVLSRCQRFDFAGIQTRSIATRLAQIAQAEGVEADPDALEVLARRAAGSMRDSQSLLEQLVAFGGERLTMADVERMLGTAGDRRLGQIAQALLDRNAASALSQFDAALTEGVDVGPLLDQLLGYFRDLMVAAVGGGGESLLHVSPAERDAVLERGRRLGLETVLAAMNIIENAIARLRVSMQGRTLAELALVRICKLEDLDQLPALVAQLRDGQFKEGPAPAVRTLPPPAAAPVAPPPPMPAPPSAEAAPPPAAAPPLAATEPAGVADGKKKEAPPEPRKVEQPSNGDRRLNLTPETAGELWRQAIATFGDVLGEHAGSHAGIAISAPNRLVVSFRPEYSFSKSICERSENAEKLEQAMAGLTGQAVRIEFTLLAGDKDERPAGMAPKPRGTPRERLMEASRHPLVARAMELFDARPVRLEEPEGVGR